MKTIIDSNGIAHFQEADLFSVDVPMEVKSLKVNGRDVVLKGEEVEVVKPKQEQVASIIGPEIKVQLIAMSTQKPNDDTDVVICKNKASLKVALPKTTDRIALNKRYLTVKKHPMSTKPITLTTEEIVEGKNDFVLEGFGAIVLFAMENEWLVFNGNKAVITESAAQPVLND